MKILLSVVFLALSLVAFPAQSGFIPKDPWRAFEDGTNYAGGPGWFEFYGKVVSVTDQGVLINGRWSIPGDPSLEQFDGFGHFALGQIFFVKHFPYAVVDDQFLGLGENYAARMSDRYSYTTALGAKATVTCFDYGQVWTAPPPKPLTSDQIAEIQEREAAQKAAAAAKALKFNQDAADRGDAYGQLRMGERYRDGDGVPRDFAKAREYLSKAADQGNADAAREIIALPLH